MLSEFNCQGILRCAKYAFMPNKLSLCGPDDNRNLFAYCCEQKADQGLKIILEKFQTLYPYLKLIAHSNLIKDPFDERVIEAYWIGNELLDNISKSKLYWHLLDTHQLKKKLNKKLLDKVIGKIPLGAKPHHSFHVLNVWNKTNNLKLADLCKISWGKILRIDYPYLEVEYQPLVFDGKLKLGPLIDYRAMCVMNKSKFVNDFQVGQWVSFHWNFVCEILNNYQVIQLKKYTEESINLCTI